MPPIKDTICRSAPDGADSVVADIRMVPREDFRFLGCTGTRATHVVDNRAKLLKGLRADTVKQLSVDLPVIRRKVVYGGTTFIGQGNDHAASIVGVSLLVQKTATHEFFGFHRYIRTRRM